MDDGVWRATTIALKDDRGSSFSRQQYTSVHQLFERLVLQVKDPTGWGVAEVVVGDARAIGFDVVAVPELDDAGHCEVRRPDGLGKKAWRLLAKVAPIDRQDGARWEHF